MTDRRMSSTALLGLVLAPVLVLCLWIEVIAGTGTAYTYAQPGQTNHLALSLWLAYAGLGPVVVVIATVRTRSQALRMASRVVRIEKWGLTISTPLAIFGLFAIAAQSVI